MGPDTAKRVARGLLAWLIAALVVRGVLLQPEHCGDPTTADLDHAAEEAIAWATRTQRPDGSWIYRYDAEHDRDFGIYEVVRHAGLTMSLYQAQRSGYTEAATPADRGLGWAKDHLVHVDGWAALADAGFGAWVPSGASALLLAGLTERREATGDDRYDSVMADLGEFLVRQVEPSGAVAAYWDPTTRAPVPHNYSPFFTGETFWALTRMHRLFPDSGWDESARRIAHYLATERDDAENRFPDVPDHWAAYGLAEMAHWPGEEDGSALDDELRAYARHVAELESMQARWDSQRTNSTFSRLTRGQTALGAAVGSIGEALSQLWRTPGLRTDAVHERARCAVGVLVSRQVTADQAARYPNPDLVQGTWLHGGVTQIDDQQHALSALLDLMQNIESGATP